MRKRVEDRLAGPVARGSGVAALGATPAGGHALGRRRRASAVHPIVGRGSRRDHDRPDRPTCRAQRDQHRDRAAPARRVPRVRGRPRREGRDPHRRRDGVLRGREPEGPPPPPAERAARAHSAAALEAGHRGDRRLVRRRRPRARVLVRPARRGQQRPASAASNAATACRSSTAAPCASLASSGSGARSISSSPAARSTPTRRSRSDS